MWPILLDLTREECRRTLRRLELEAYSNMISVFRAQGPLEDTRKKLLEELRAVLHISNDRHSAEARRVSNDELLATIAEQLAGPNTGIGWICEGRRRIPLLPRAVAQTMYTEMADKAAEAVANEHKELQKRLEAEKLVAPKTEREEMLDTEGQTAESAVPSNSKMDETMYPPVATEDHSTKEWEAEVFSRKRKLTDNVGLHEDGTPVKNMRNIPVNTNQKHLNLSQIYSKFSQPPPASSKSSGQSKHSYNQVSKVSTSKSNQPHTPRPHKHRSHKQKLSGSKSQKKSQEMQMSPHKQYSPSSMQIEYGGPPTSFQATYAQSIMGGKSKPDYMDEMKPKVLSSPGMVTDSPTMQLLTQPATLPHELGVTDSVHPDDHSLLQAQATPTPKSVGSKPCHLIIKKRGEVTTTDKKLQMSDLKIVQKPTDSGIKLLSNRQVVVAPNSAQKALNASQKLITTKVIGSIPKSRPSTAPVITEKMIVVSKPASEPKTICNSKVIITSGVGTPSKDNSPTSANSMSPRICETITPKGIPATDLKVSAKAIVLNPKSGQKMVVLPAKSRTKPGPEGQLPLLHLKTVPTTMKLLQPMTPATKNPAMTVVSKPAGASTMQPSSKVVGMEPIKTANMADIVPVKGLAPVTTPKLNNPIMRPGSAKGNVIVVQKGATIGKALTFAKNGNDMSKIIMGKNVNKLLASKPEQREGTKCAGNVIVLELNNEQPGRPTTMSEILDARGRADEPATHITQDTPVLFDSQTTDDSCTANSLDSAVESMSDIVSIDQATLPIIQKDMKDAEGVKDSSSVTDWEIELEPVSRKDKDDEDKLNSLHLDLGMSSDSDNEFMVDRHKAKSKHTAQGIQPATSSGEGGEVYGGMTLATRTLLSQLQDEGSSSNDSSFALKAKSSKEKAEKPEGELEEMLKAQERLSEKVAEARSRQRRIDVYSTAIASADMTLDPFSYLEEGLMAGDDDFPEERREPAPADKP